MQKVLIITYYWPPAGGPGVLRWLKFAKYLRDFDIEPVLYIPENPHYPILDKTLIDQVPKGITIYKRPIREPFSIASFLFRKKTQRISSGIIQTKNQSIIEKTMLYIRGNWFIPDARKYWVKPSVKFLSGVLEQDHIEHIITTGPPHSLHLIGYQLKKRCGVQWFADFRDPWTTIGYHSKLKMTENSLKKHRQLERMVLNAADKIIATSKVTKREFMSLTKKPIVVITNGYDSDYVGNANRNVKFTISHIGSLLSGRNPHNLWKVLAELVHENRAFGEELQLQLIGVVSQDVLHSIHENGLEGHVRVMGYVPHEKAIEYQQKSQVLLLVEIDADQTRGIIPGKLFEYMAAMRPILAIGPNQWEAGQMVTETSIGHTFTYAETTHLKEVLLKWFDAYRTGTLVVAAKGIEKYSRRELTKQLANQL
ncbi:MAG: glycosyltransferase family 4 protein [Maribacter sp.]|nr:glycosyltransferase family 4 protein [Maribacter sp.]